MCPYAIFQTFCNVKLEVNVFFMSFYCFLFGKNFCKSPNLFWLTGVFLKIERLLANLFVNFLSYFNERGQALIVFLFLPLIDQMQMSACKELFSDKLFNISGCLAKFPPASFLNLFHVEFFFS